MTSRPRLAPAGPRGALVLVYFYSHYLFASGAAHIGAMYAPHAGALDTRFS